MGEYGADCSEVLYGHSLSWTDNKQPKYGPNNTLVTKLWIPSTGDVTMDSNNLHEQQQHYPL